MEYLNVKWDEQKDAEIERLRSIEAAARNVTASTPLDRIGDIWECWYCTALSRRGEAPAEHEPHCPWLALRAALGQGHAGERGGSGSGEEGVE